MINPVSPEEGHRMLSLRGQSFSNTEIAKIMHRNRGTVITTLRKLDAGLPLYTTNTMPIAGTEAKKMLALADAHCMNCIRLKFKRSQAYVWTLFKKHGVTGTPCKCQSGKSGPKAVAKVKVASAPMPKPVKIAKAAPLPAIIAMTAARKLVALRHPKMYPDFLAEKLTRDLPGPDVLARDVVALRQERRI